MDRHARQASFSRNNDNPHRRKWSPYAARAPAALRHYGPIATAGVSCWANCRAPLCAGRMVRWQERSKRRSPVDTISRTYWPRSASGITSAFRRTDPGRLSRLRTGQQPVAVGPPWQQHHRARRTNANPTSMEAAARISSDCGRSETVCLGEMAELGEASEEEHMHAGGATAPLRILATSSLVGARFATWAGRLSVHAFRRFRKGCGLDAPATLRTDLVSRQGFPAARRWKRWRKRSPVEWLLQLHAQDQFSSCKHESSHLLAISSIHRRTSWAFAWWS